MYCATRQKIVSYSTINTIYTLSWLQFAIYIAKNCVLTTWNKIVIILQAYCKHTIFLHPYSLTQLFFYWIHIDCHPWTIQTDLNSDCGWNLGVIIQTKTVMQYSDTSCALQGGAVEEFLNSDGLWPSKWSCWGVDFMNADCEAAQNGSNLWINIWINIC